MAVIVNGRIDPPGFFCPDSPGGTPEFLHFDGLAYLCPMGDNCAILITDWASHLGTHEATCANAIGVSDPLVVVVPELGLVPGILFGIACAAALRWLLHR